MLAVGSRSILQLAYIAARQAIEDKPSFHRGPPIVVVHIRPRRGIHCVGSIFPPGHE